MLRNARIMARGLCTSSRPSKHCFQSMTWLADIVGDIGAPITRRAPAGEVLKMVDVSSVATAMAHASDNDSAASASTIAGASCVTLSFDRVDLMVPILHGDFLRLDSRMVSVGNSAMVVQVTGTKKCVQSRSYKPVLRCLTTFVALDENGKSKQVPSLEPAPAGTYCLPDQEEGIETIECEERYFDDHSLEVERQKRSSWTKQRRELAAKMDKQQKETEAEVMNAVETGTLANLLPEIFDPGESEYRRLERIRMRDTKLEMRKMFMPMHANPGGAVFGGDLLEWMEKSALGCAINFTKNSDMVTISLDRLFFQKSIKPGDFLSLTAQVVFVTQHTVHVQTVVEIVRRQGDEEIKEYSHTGNFVVLNMDKVGAKEEVMVGLALDKSSDPDEIVLYAKGKQRHISWRENRTLS